MVKGNYRAWIISIGLHVILIIAVARQPVTILDSNPAPVMKAYLSVNLSSLPKVIPPSEKATIHEVSPSTEPTVTKGEKAIKSVDTHQEQQSSGSKLRDAKAKHLASQTQTGPEETDLSAFTKESAGQNSPTFVTQGNQTDFKKLNPFAALPFTVMDSVLKQDKERFEHLKQKSQDQQTIHDRITVPKAHWNEQNSEIIAISAGGSKRIERWQGKCYNVDLATVFGKSGMPQGRPGLCPGEKSDDQILLEKSMKKWERVSRTK